MAKKEKKPRRRLRDRRDARFVKAPGLQTVMGYLWPKRTDCGVYLNDMIDATELMKYLDRRNAEHPEYKTTLFHAAIAEGVPRLLEHRDLRWITVAEIPQYGFCPADEEILAALKADRGICR